MEEVKNTIRKLSEKQRQVFDQICINNDAGHHPNTLDSLVKKGLIVSYEQCFPGGAIFRYDVASYQVHMAWCKLCEEESPEESLE